MGGSKPQPGQVITLPQQPPAPSPAETTAQSMQAQLQYNPQLYEQYARSYQTYLPQMAETELGVQQRFAPELQALQRQMYPQQTQLIEALAGQALQRMQSPFGYTPEEQSALDAIRERTREQIRRNVRERANVGGGLYGGRTELAEQRGLSELEQMLAQEDINRRLMASQQALQYGIPVVQVQYPQVATPQMPNYWQQAVPSGDEIYRAMYESSRVPYAIQPAIPGSPSPIWGLAGNVLGGLAGGVGLGLGSKWAK